MKELIQRCQQGDREAMGQLYTVMHDELLAHCRKFAANDNVAEDLLHDAFLLIFSNIEKLHSLEKGRAWMHKVVRNVCLLYVQYQKNRPSVSIDEVRETAESASTELPLTYEDIQKAIDQLPRGYRQVFRLSVIDGLTHLQIAELLSIEPHTSSSQLLRAKRQLKRLLQVLMLSLLVAVPFGAYYFWSLQNNKHGVAVVSDKTPEDARDIPEDHIEDVDETASPQAITVSGTSVYLPNKGMADSTKAADKSMWSADSSDDPGQALAQTTPQTEDGTKHEKDNVKEENYRADVINEDVSEQVTVQNTVKNDTTVNGLALPQESIVLPSVPTTDSNIFLSLAYTGLPNGSARQLPDGVDGMNGDIDSVSHHRMPVSLALNARYNLGSSWWLDGGLRYTLLSSETRVGNTYLYMMQQQYVRYLGLSLGVGYDLWRRNQWNLYATTSVCYELPLRSTTDISYWRGGRLIDTEKNRLTLHPQWSVGIGLGMQYNLTPSIGFFAEPNLQYYFRNSDGINTWRSEHPFTPMLPLGIRISF